MSKMLLASFATGLLVFCLTAQTANAQSVEACPPGGDPAACKGYATIQEAVNDAPPNSVISLSSGVHLAPGVLIENKDLTIRGKGASDTVVQAANTACVNATPDRVFRITSARVRIEDLTIQNGCLQFPTQPALGAGIWNAGSLTLKHVVVRDNVIKYDGIPPSVDSWLPMGGGIYSVGSLEIINSTVMSNSVNTPGGRALGGGIYNNGRAYIVNSTISGNTATGDGGASDTLRGGGVYNAGTLIMEYTTVVNNTALSAGGGLYSVGEFELANNLFFNNSSLGGEANCQAPVQHTSLGASAGGDANSCNEKELSDVNLGLLRFDYKAPVYIPSPNSDSVDNGSCALSKVKVDQIGSPRGRGSECDLGAIEAGASFMPFVYTPLPVPDLIVREVTIEPAGQLNAGTLATIKVTIQNIGTKATSGGFYIDLFINPSRVPPNYAGTTWTDLCRTDFCRDDEGIVWQAPPTIYPNESFTFSSDLDLDEYAVRRASKWDKFFGAGEVRIWAFVDSYATNRPPQGNIAESNEFNNLFEVPVFTVLPGRIPPLASSAAEVADLFAPRPQP